MMQTSIRLIIQYMFVTTLILIGLTTSCLAQKNDHVYHELPVYGKLMPLSQKYHRIDTLKYKDLPKAVKSLYTHSAGLFVHFRTNATAVSAEWCVTDREMNLNLTAIANKGLDVYIKNNQGKWQYAGSKGTAKRCASSILVENLDSSAKDFIIYLPLFDEVTSLKIGVPAEAIFTPLANPFTKKIAIYGSSIVHGASASRAGMAYPAILSRRTGYQVINLGVSGNARIEKEVAHMLADSDPDLFILDCVPNSSPEEIEQRTLYFVEYIRKKHPHTPILMVSSVTRELSSFNKYWNIRNRAQNIAWRKQFEALIDRKVSNLYYLSAEELLGDDHEGTTDGVHPNDLGFHRMADGIEPIILDILQHARK